MLTAISRSSQMVVNPLSPGQRTPVKFNVLNAFCNIWKINLKK